MHPVLESVATAITDSDDMESFVRPLLEILEAVTGLESTYLTTIDTRQGLQHILFSHNSRDLSIPEGMDVPWDDTLCKRSLEEGRFYTDDADVCWADSAPARALGIVTYLSQPIRVGQGELYGTLCGASMQRVRITEDAHRLLVMFAQLISLQIERQQLLSRLREENATFQQHASTDPLTGLLNRRACLRELARCLEMAQRSEAMVHVAFIDLDGFKQINDNHGHDVGDRFLLEMADRLKKGLRQADIVARIGGDEFVVIGMDFEADADSNAQQFQQHLAELTRGLYFIDGLVLDYPGASVGVVSSRDGQEQSEALLKAADNAMYQIKRQRKAGSQAQAQ